MCFEVCVRASERMCVCAGVRKLKQKCVHIRDTERRNKFTFKVRKTEYEAHLTFCHLSVNFVIQHQFSALHITSMN